MQCSPDDGSDTRLPQATTDAPPLGTVARRWVPVVVGMTVASGVELLLPSGVWIAAGAGFAGQMLTKTAEEGMGRGGENLGRRIADWAVAAVAGETLQDPAPAGDEGVELSALVTPDEALLTHVLGAQNLIGHVRNDPYGSGSAASEAREHLVRVIELAADHGARSRVLREAAELAVDALAHLATGDLSAVRAAAVAAEAVQLCRRARGEPSGFNPSPKYVEVPFDSAWPEESDSIELSKQLGTLRQGWRARQSLGQAADHTVSERGRVLGVPEDSDYREGGEGGTSLLSI